MRPDADRVVSKKSARPNAVSVAALGIAAAATGTFTLGERPHVATPIVPNTRHNPDVTITE